MIIAAYRDGAFNLTLLLHIATAVVGFGAVSLRSVLDNQARRRPPAHAQAIAEAFQRVSATADIAVYLVPVFGIALIFQSGDTYSFSDLWISLSFLVYIAMLGVNHGLLRSSNRRLISALDDGGSAGEIAALRQRLALGSSVSNVLLVIALVLMIWRPGA